MSKFDFLMNTTTATERTSVSIVSLCALVSTCVHLVYGFAYGISFSGVSLFMVLCYLVVICALLGYYSRLEGMGWLRND